MSRRKKANEALQEYISHRERKEYRRGFLAGFNFAVGKGGLPPEIIDWPSALKEVTQDDDHRCT